MTFIDVQIVLLIFTAFYCITEGHVKFIVLPVKEGGNVFG